MTIRTVTSDAEYAIEYAAAISGDTIEFSGSSFTQRTIDKSGLIFASADGSSSIPSLLFNRTVNGFTADSLHLKMTGWPKTYGACLIFNTGTYSNLDLGNGSSFAHGYGASIVPIDQTANYSEYNRVDNLQNASTTSAAYAITWQDATATSGSIYFFNHGVTNVYVKVGGAGVVATASDTLVPPGVGGQLMTSRNPTIDTHWAVISASGTPEVNARAEIGLTYYQATAFSSSGGAVVSNLQVHNCLFQDLINGIKGINSYGYARYYDNDLKAIYGDIISLPVGPGSEIIVARNTYDVSYCRSGIAEALNGDAGDPHGDSFQMFGTGAGTVGPVYSAGNRARVPAQRLGAASQGNFWSDNDYSPSYGLVWSISETLLGGAPNGFSCGENSYPAKNVFIYGATMLAGATFPSGNTNIAIAAGADVGDACVVDRSVVQGGLTANTGVLARNNSLLLSEAASAAAVFPDIADLTAATDRASVELALTTAVEGVGRGASATADAIDWVTTDPTAIILWENVSSGVAWNDVTQVTPSTIYTFPKRKILNRKAAQTVVAGSGVEWRSFDTDGTSELQAWTSTSGTIEPDQFVQIRKAASATSFATVTATITINDQDVSPTIRAAGVLSNAFRLDGVAYFSDTANVPASTTVIEWETKANLATITTGSVYIHQVVSDIIAAILASGGGTMSLSVENSAGAPVYNSGSVISIPQNQVIVLNTKVDFGTLTASVTLNGEAVLSAAITDSPGNNYVQTSRKINFGTATQFLKADSDVEYHKVWLTTSGVRTLHKEISVSALGSISAVNSDPWKVGGTIVAAPDTTPPTVYGLIASPTGTDSLDIDFATTDGNGTAYWFVSTSATPPSATDLIAGTGSVAYGSVAVSASGLQATILVSGLTPETVYYVYVMHDDAATNRSDIVSDSVETPSGTPTWQDITILRHALLI